MYEAKGDSTGYVMRFSHLKGWHNPSNILRFEKQSHEGLSYRMRPEAFMAFFFGEALRHMDPALIKSGQRSVRNKRTSGMNQQKRTIRKYWNWRSLSYPWDTEKSEAVADTWETLLAHHSQALSEYGLLTWARARANSRSIWQGLDFVSRE